MENVRKDGYKQRRKANVVIKIIALKQKILGTRICSQTARFRRRHTDLGASVFAPAGRKETRLRWSMKPPSAKARRYKAFSSIGAPKLYFDLYFAMRIELYLYYIIFLEECQMWRSGF